MVVSFDLFLILVVWVGVELDMECMIDGWDISVFIMELVELIILYDVYYYYFWGWFDVVCLGFWKFVIYFGCC